MRYKMEISFSETTNKLEVDCPIVGSIAETVLNDDKINDQLYDIFCDEISNAMDTYEKEPLDSFDEKYIHKLVYDAAYKYFPKCKQMELNDALEMVVKEMNYITSDNDEIPNYKVGQNKTVLVPKTFSELKALLSSGMVFSLLRI